MPNQPLPYHPVTGQVLTCDYAGLVPPEMSKRRFVVVISPRMRHRPNLCTVVPLSTTPPHNIKLYHVQLEKDPYPKSAPGTIVWAKCDMLMTVSFARLSGYWDGKINGRRNYVTLSISNEELAAVKTGVLHALGMAA